MRYLGKIKWYGGFNSKTYDINDYGFISANTGEDLFIHESNLLCEPSELQEGTLVTFEIELNKKNNEAKAAKDVRLAKDDTDEYWLEFWLDNWEDLEWCRKRIIDYLNSKTSDEAIEFILTKQSSMIPKNKSQFDNFLKSLQENVALASELRPIRLNLSQTYFSRIAPKLWSYAMNDNVEDEVLEYLTSSSAIKSIMSCWRKMPDSFIVRPRVWALAPLFIKIKYIATQKEITEEDHRTILEAFDSSELTQDQVDELLHLMPDEIVDDPNFLKYFPPKQQIQSLLEHDTLDEERIVLIAQSMGELAKSDLTEVIQQLPIEVRLNPLVFAMLPPKQQIQVLLEQDTLDEERIVLIAQSMGELAKSDLAEVIQQLPIEVRLNPLVFAMLPPKQQIQSLIEQSTMDEEVILFVAQAMEKLNQSDSDDDYANLCEISNILPREILENWSVIPYLPDDVKFDVILSKLPIYVEELELLARVLKTLTQEKRDIIFDQMPTAYLKYVAIFPLLNDKQQHMAVWPDISVGDISEWNNMSETARMYTIFRAVKENVSFNPSKENTKEVHKILQACLNIYWAIQNPQNAQNAINKAHDLIADYVCEIAWDLDEDLNIFGNYPNSKGILPPCGAGVVRFCEGREWFTDEEKKKSSKITERAFCPRLGGPCGVSGSEDVQAYYYTGARLYPKPTLAWEDWSLFELLNASNVYPIVDGIRNLGDYITKLSGWLNRLHEIRERLRCSVCHDTMKPNYEYAKNLARYRVTIVSCDHGHSHDENIYLNHCWGCNAIIDSRESRYQVGKYYVCIHCGSGPQAHPTYRQGDMCPKCGTPKMIQSDYNDRYFTCSNSSCNHEIRVPTKLTGIAKTAKSSDEDRQIS